MSDYDEYDEKDEAGFAFSGKLWTLILIGVALVFVGVGVIIFASVLLGGGNVGGVIFLGPIPIVFGNTPDMPWLILIGIAITVISVIAFIIINRRR